MEKIQEFIKNNNLSFERGSRNTSCTILTGYSQFLELTEEQLKEELKNEIKNDSFISEEISRIFPYCKAKNYKDFWVKEEAKLQYTFI